MILWSQAGASSACGLWSSRCRWSLLLDCCWICCWISLTCCWLNLCCSATAAAVNGWSCGDSWFCCCVCCWFCCCCWIWASCCWICSWCCWLWYAISSSWCLLNCWCLATADSPDESGLFCWWICAWTISACCLLKSCWWAIADASNSAWKVAMGWSLRKVVTCLLLGDGWLPAWNCWSCKGSCGWVLSFRVCWSWVWSFRDWAWGALKACCCICCWISSACCLLNSFCLASVVLNTAA